MPTNESCTLTRVSKAAIVHKVIDITPDSEPAVPGNSFQAVFQKVSTAAERYRGSLFGVAAVLFAVIIVLLAFPRRTQKPGFAVSTPGPALSVKPPAASSKPAAPVLVELNLPTAVQKGLAECQWRGNGKDRLFLDARNTGTQPLRLHVPAGQILASVDSTITLLNSQTLDLEPHAVLHRELRTAATSSANKVTGAEYHLSAGTLPDLDKLFAWLASHPNTHFAAIQTATLILTENPPLAAFAKFNELSAGAANLQNSQDFKADTIDILTALSIVRDIGIDRPLTVTIDPQLEVEAMIDPEAHALAVAYYNISDEWAFWKTQLLEGDPSTRHYALYGIARFYPDIAVKMLPKWARGTSVSPVFRLSAVEALGQTNRPEAIPILRELEREFGGASDLGHAAHLSANYLDAQFARPPSLASAGN